MARRNLSGIGSVLLLSLLLLSYQNCVKSEMQPVQDLKVIADCEGPECEPEPPPCLTADDCEPPPIADVKAAIKKSVEKNLLNDCFANTGFNACVFWKNPVAQRGSAYGTPVNAGSNLSADQVHAVKLEGYDDSGLLKNSSFLVRALTPAGRLESLSTTSKQFKYNFGNDALHRAGQVMAFYWLTLQEKYMSVVTGAFFAAKKGISVISFVANFENAYWDSDLQEVVIGSSASGNEFALSAEVYAHEMGHGNISYATNLKIEETVGAFESISCANNQAVCCKTANGCSWAINEGQADYHAAILFPTNTNMLETFFNSQAGLSECGLPRGIDANKNLTAVQAYDACPAGPPSVKGEVHVTGRIYASVWWEVRKAAEAAEPGKGADEVDVLFTNHLVALEGRDTFITAFDKIEAVDLALYKSKYTQKFKDEFIKRGLAVQ